MTTPEKQEQLEKRENRNNGRKTTVKLQTQENQETQEPHGKAGTTENTGVHGECAVSVQWLIAVRAYCNVFEEYLSKSAAIGECAVAHHIGYML